MDAKLLTDLEERYKLQPGLLNAVMMQESGGKPDAVSPRGAKGWFQFMPDTAEEWGVGDPTDFKQAATGAAKYLSNLYSQFGNWEDALRAYNWGQGNVRKHKAGARVDMPTEAKEYPTRVMARLSTSSSEEDIPDVDDAEDIPEIPDEIQAAAPKSAVRDWQKELDEAPGTTLLPIVGGALFGVGGGVAGAPTVVGAPAGAAAGGTGGAVLGYALAIRNHEAPIEEKIKFLVNKFNLEAVMNLGGMKVAQTLTKVLAKTPADQIAIEQWFAQNGSLYRPNMGEAASRATGIHRDAVKHMAEDVDAAIGRNLARLNVGGSPTDMGKVFQGAYRETMEKLSAEHAVRFAPYKHGTTLGNATTKPTTSAQDAAKEVLQKFKDTGMTEKDAGASASIMRIVQSIAAGKEVPLATLVEQKRALANTANWDVLKGSVDNSIRKRLAQEIDKSIEAKLGALDPRELTRWHAVNRATSRELGILDETMIYKMASSDKMDPMKVTEFVADNASPTAIEAYKRALGLMRTRGALTAQQADHLMDNVRRNWIEKNMSNSKAAADMYESLLGAGKNQETVDAFNAVFKNSPYRAVLEDTAKAAHALRQFSEKIPAQWGSPGEYVVAGAVGSAVGNVPGAALAIGVVWLTHAVPKALARSAVEKNSIVRNSARHVVAWMNQATPEELKQFAKGVTTVMPASVYKAYTTVNDYNAKNDLVDQIPR